jgi:hypothetical protein
MATERTTGSAGRARTDASSTIEDRWQDSAAPAGATAMGTTTESTTSTGADVGNTGTTASTGNLRDASSTSARGLMDSAREGARRQLSTQKDRAASGLSTLVDSLRESGRQLKQQDSGMASFTEGAADHLSRLVEGLRQKDVGRMASDLEHFARRRPGVFVGAAFLAGLAAARFLKSSAETGSSGQQWGSYSGQTPVSSQQSRGGTYGQSG